MSAAQVQLNPFWPRPSRLVPDTDCEELMRICASTMRWLKQDLKLCTLAFASRTLDPMREAATLLNDTEQHSCGPNRKNRVLGRSRT